MSETSGITVKQSEISGAGRGLFAERDFTPGDLVLAVERPLVAELETDRLLDTCGWCCQRGLTDPTERAQAAAMGLPIGLTETKSCAGCRRVSYCSKACQSRAWKREHKFECKVLKPRERPDLPFQVRAVIKLLGRLMADPEGKRDSIYDLLKFRPAGAPDALDEFCKRDKKRFDDYQMLGQAAWHYAGEPKLPVVDVELSAASKALMLNVMCNTFKLASPLEDEEVGSGFDPLICAANHSCEPNVALVFNQPRTLLRALRPIKRGEEITVQYTEVTNPMSIRHAELEETHMFTCHCPKCQKGPVGPEDLFLQPPENLSAEHSKFADGLIKSHGPELQKRIPSAVQDTALRRLAAMQIEAFSVCDDAQSTVEDVRKVLQMCITSGMWSWTRQPVPQLCRRLFGQYVAGGEAYRALRVGLKVYFEIAPVLHPDQPFHPDRLVDAWTLSTVINVLCGPRHEDVYRELKVEAGLELRLVYFGFLFEVRENVGRMYGLDSPFGRLVESTHRQIMAGVGRPEAEIRQKLADAWPTLEMVARSLDVSSL
ncbi:hypothetical protein GGR56DRAFT_298060 [Xylariaceae sp. FL0804]|nr:hypothetical protein GGR56DRAFT_298060 [Xylariaceae sp. FL0804]